MVASLCACNPNKIPSLVQSTTVLIALEILRRLRFVLTVIVCVCVNVCVCDKKTCLDIALKMSCNVTEQA